MAVLEGVTLASFEQLENGLRSWMSFGDAQVYDAAGMMSLLCACLENLRTHVLDAEATELGRALTDEERRFIKALARFDRLDE